MNIQINTEKKEIVIIEADMVELINLIKEYSDFKVVSFVKEIWTAPTPTVFPQWEPNYTSPINPYDPYCTTPIDKINKSIFE